MVFEVYLLKTRGAKFWFCFFSLLTADWLRTSGCLHGRALDMVICVALYQGLQIFAGRFGGKCLDQRKHCRPQRNPRSSKDHSRAPCSVLLSLQRKLLNLCQTGWAHWMGPSQWKDSDFWSWFWFHHTGFVHSISMTDTVESQGPNSQECWIPALDLLVTCWVTLPSHQPSLGSGFLSFKRWWSLKSHSLILYVCEVPLRV